MISTDYVLDYMKKKNIPLTRKNYLDMAYLGKPPEIDAEMEEELPPQVRFNHEEPAPALPPSPPKPDAKTAAGMKFLSGS